jgi:hypothetical protein
LGSGDQRAARYRSLLAGRRVLVVLDNAGSVEQVEPLLPGSETCAVVVTSRDSLPGLLVRYGAARLDLDLLSLADAIELLRELGVPEAERVRSLLTEAPPPDGAPDTVSRERDRRRETAERGTWNR